MAVRIIAIQTLLFFVTYTVAGQSSLEPIIVVLVRTAAGATGNANPTCLLQNPPVARRDDYTYFPGIGGYKLHPGDASWNEARITCEEEGGHLAIINSSAERDAVVTVLKATNTNWLWVNKWADGEPNNENGHGNCGYLHPSGVLDVGKCVGALPFVCELPIH